MKLFLLGMMGSGKSYWSKKLAKKLKCGAYDLDAIIEMNEEKTINEIFKEDGEDYFRKTETKILKWFAEKKTYVLATGGGTPCFNSNVEWMNLHGITIWIDEPVETLVERLKPEKSHRPLISNLSDDELYWFLNKKLIERTPFYAQAQHRLHGNKISDKSFAEIIK